MKCVKCGRDNLTKDDFYPRSGERRGCQGGLLLMAHCKECHKEWVRRNRARRIAAGYRPSESDIEARRAKAREYQRSRYYEDIEKSRAQGREKYWRRKRRKKIWEG